VGGAGGGGVGGAGGGEVSTVVEYLPPGTTASLDALLVDLDVATRRSDRHRDLHAQVRKVVLPGKPTRARYGLTLEDWRALVWACKGVCAVCGKLPKSGRLYIDHEHVPGWAKWPGPARAGAVRGLLCYTCNRFLVGKHCARTATLVADYLRRYENRSSFTEARR